jgi:hypothetical protein
MINFLIWLVVGGIIGGLVSVVIGMDIKRRLCAAFVMLLAVYWVGPTPLAHAADFTCTGPIAGPVVIPGNLRVPTACELTGLVTVQGNVTVEPGATLDMSTTTVQGNVHVRTAAHYISHAGNRIDGSLIAEQAASVDIFDDTVGGNIQITGVTGLISVRRTTLLNGNIVVAKSNNVMNLEVFNNVVEKGNLQVFANVVSVNLLIQGNSIRTDAPNDNAQVYDNAVGRIFRVQNNIIEQNLQVFKNTSNEIVVQGNIQSLRVQAVGENLQVFENTARVAMTVQDNIVADTLQVYKNTGPTVTVQLNKVDENLQCFENKALFLGGPNVVARQPQGQCF